MDIFSFLAKSDGTSLVDHTEHVLKAGKRLLSCLPISNEERHLLENKLLTAIILHDIGKIHPSFEHNLNNETGRIPIRHEIISLFIAESFLELSLLELFIIATHHKGIVEEGSSSKFLKLDTLTDHLNKQIIEFGDLKSEIKIFLKKWLEKFKVTLQFKSNLQASLENHKLSKETIRALIKSTQKKDIPKHEDRLKLSKLRGLLMAADHIGSARLEDQIPKMPIIEVHQIQPEQGFRNFQEKMGKVEGSCILHAPTGSGKTEAALNWVVNNQTSNSRIFYILPFTASINAMVSRLEEKLGKGLVTPLHSRTLDYFYEDVEKETNNYKKKSDEARKLSGLSREIFFPIKIATPHQIIKAALMGKGWEMNLWDFPNAIFIIDEFHTYDPLLSGLLLATVKWLEDNFNAKFCFMSATIPAFMQNLIIENVLGNDSSKIFRPDPNSETDKLILNRKRHVLKTCRNKSILDDLELIKDKIRRSIKNESVLIVVNNISTCQKLYNELSEFENREMLHGGLHKKDRIDIESRITNKDIKERPKVLIATQAVEVSLDIDYKIAFIENAPIDALIQRFGRVNRAGKNKKPALVYLYENIIGNVKKIYCEDTLTKTFNVLEKFQGFEISEQDLVGACNEVYQNGYNELQRKDFEQGLCHPVINNFPENVIAGYWDENVSDEIIKHDNAKIDILCFNLQEEYGKLKEVGRYIEANQLLVSIYSFQSTRKVKERDVIVARDIEYISKFGVRKFGKERDSNIL
ncbi:CRISPR-associated helicase Cas3' [Cytophagaceae bacterium ABcell3]|nr:CRISPR-associated helicase Cas3' [Cytophagaceae bacterium ABcell3]